MLRSIGNMLPSHHSHTSSHPMPMQRNALVAAIALGLFTALYKRENPEIGLGVLAFAATYLVCLLIPNFGALLMPFGAIYIIYLFIRLLVALLTAPASE